MTLPRTGQRKVGSAPVASLGLTAWASTTAAGAAGASTLPVACAIRTLCGAPATILTGGAAAAGTVATTGDAGAAARGFGPGNVSFMPRPDLAYTCGVFALAGFANGAMFP